MKDYFSTDSTDLTDFYEENISKLYQQGYLFTRRAKGNLYQTRSLRVDLEKFELSSENRRILRKNETLALGVKKLPYEDYTWEIHKLGKNFYSQKFGDGTMSAVKIKELFQDQEKSNMTHVLTYTRENQTLGYCLAYVNSEIVHYAYPFYDLSVPKEQSLGLAMMTQALVWAKTEKKKYVYLGSVTTPEANYKLQFTGGEWWDLEQKRWSTDYTKLKEILNSEATL